MEHHHEQIIAVIGGGPAGLFTAIGLRNQGFSVVVFEKGNYSDYCAGEHLLPDTLPVLRELGIPSSIWESCSDPCFEVESAWGSDRFESTNSVNSPFGPGLLLYRPEFDRALAAYARVRGVELLTDVRVDDLQQINGSWIIDYRHEETRKTLHAVFLVDASGKNSRFVSALGCRRHNHDSLTAFTWYCQPDDHNKPQPGKLQVEATEYGWWYSTLVRNDLMIVSFMTDADIAAKHGIITSDLVSLVESAQGIRQFIRTARHISEVIAVAARTRCLSRLTGHNWIATGDAAWSIDPLSSQGLYKAARTGLDASSAIQQHFDGQADALEIYNQMYLDMFTRNLGLRARYYRMEDRWPDAGFWSRRHQPGWTEIPLTMDPATVIGKEIDGKDQRLHDLKTLTPAVDPHLLTHVMSCSNTAVEAVDRYKSLSLHDVHDRELIVAVQHLLDFTEVTAPEYT